ncbi:MAG: glycosyltransferase [Anaerolineae bacterium]|nr:glycosyltransferase [Anaerolineae bacterium]
MKILHVYKDYFPVLGGIENHIKTLAEAQVQAGHKVTVLVCDPGPRTHIETRNGVKVIKAGRLFTAASMPVSLTQPLIVARLRPDILHVQGPYPLGELSAWLFGGKTPFVLSYQSDIVRQKNLLRLYGPFLRRVLRHADRILANSPRYIETSPWLQSVKAKCQSVPIGIDVQRFTVPEHGYTGSPTLLFVGRLRYYKGLDTLVAAMRDLPGVHLKLAGDGPMYAQLQAQVQALALTERVHFLGEIADEELPALYHKAHVFVLPSNARAEAYGIVLLEAMASGLPCVSTEVGTGTSWVVQDGVTGRVVPPQDPTALAGALRELVDDPEKRRVMGQAGRLRVETEFTQELMTQRVMAVYESLL